MVAGHRTGIDDNMSLLKAEMQVRFQSSIVWFQTHSTQKQTQLLDACIDSSEEPLVERYVAELDVLLQQKVNFIKHNLKNNLKFQKNKNKKASQLAALQELVDTFKSEYMVEVQQ